MQTKLTAQTLPMVDGITTAEEFIVYIARVSNPSNQLNTETGSKLIRYLIKNKHFSPFEHVTASFEIKTSRAIAAQILRHRSFTFQEFSQRYATATTLEPLQWRMQGKTNRQVGDADAQLNEEAQFQVYHVQQKCLETYDTLIAAGVAKECARMILPLNTETTIYMSGTLRSWIHYFDLRCSEKTQKEHRDIAISIRDQIKVVFPETFKALDELNEVK